MDGGPIDDGGNDDSLESAAADNELVKFVNKVIIDAYNQKASDIHIEPMPGKFKTGIRFRIDGTLALHRGAGAFPGRPWSRA
jgi:type II secretory ATPase GspE/PulE/Tfp pilus assembly ATPase PilB-like protein